MDAVFFRTAAEFRRWLARNHATARERLLGFHRKGLAKPGISYAEALDEALCFGWIDGVRKNRDEDSYTIRFTPRKPGSIWSLINVGHVERLIAAGRMQPVGMQAFEARQAAKTGVYSFEQKHHAFDPSLEKRFRANKRAWTFWDAQPPGYKRVATHWVMSAKREETRDRRLAILIDDSAKGLRLAEITGVKREK